MPWRFILVLIIFAVFLTFIMFNLDNRCDVNFGFTVVDEVPVFLTVFISFIIGVICAFPLVMHIKKKEKNKKPAPSAPAAKTNTPAAPAEPGTDEKIKQDAASARARFFAKRGGKKSSDGGSGGK
ncbi:MAG: hypothetical protein FWD22_03330 [Treponema sp.]|nr:hypothetical protein [Treponema sp.]